MYQALPFGPVTLPTGPLLAMLAVFLGLETAGRFGRRLGLRTDDVWNTGLLAVLAGLIVARLWNVFQFWYVYTAEPLLIVSLRPSGFALWPGCWRPLRRDTPTCCATRSARRASPPPSPSAR
jgi:prolipoprotein diacylglyceryltransferase